MRLLAFLTDKDLLLACFNALVPLKVLNTRINYTNQIYLIFLLASSIANEALHCISYYKACSIIIMPR